jgi:hypothetical protein
MTIENCLKIAFIIATLIAPSLAEFIKSRLNRPKASLDPNQPTPRIRRIGDSLANILYSPWYLPGFLILYNSYFLWLELLSPAPVTRHEVFNICSSVAGTLYAIILMSINNVWKQQRENNDRIVGLLNTHTEIIGSTVDDLHTTAKTIHLIQQSQDMLAKITELESRERKLSKKGLRQLK